ncbi:MAG: sugar phosphate nucleotidyltransferase [Patescibacteria group bacterium]
MPSQTTDLKIKSRNSRSSDSSALKIALFCGGTGTRMWPMSRKALPKQFQPLIENQSTFEMMINRLSSKFAMHNIFPVTTRDNVGWIVKLAPEIPLENIIIEPEMRDTAAAVGLAAAVLDKKFNDPSVVSLWSDHVVRNEKQFIAAIELAAKTAQETGKFVKIGVRPTFPSVALGYLKVGKMLKRENGMAIFEYITQIEKPKYEEAKNFTESWEYLWHIGYSVWSAAKMLDFYEKYFKEGASPLVKIQKAWGTPEQEAVLKEEYTKIPKTSVDFAIYSHLTPADQVVVSADLGWRDVGTWNELKDEMAAKPQDNIFQGLVMDIDLKDCLVYSNKKEKIIAAIGLEGLVIVDTEDALLICPKDKTQDVKKVIERLKEENKEDFL